jgi:hypothetical protein
VRPAVLVGLELLEQKLAHRRRHLPRARAARSTSDDYEGTFVVSPHPRGRLHTQCVGKRPGAQARA